MDKSDEQARERLAQQRQHTDHTHDNLLSRAEAEVHESPAASVEERARQAMANQRHHKDHTEHTLLERSDEELHQP
ncbi:MULTISPECIES: hypothetical protein [Cyanophyceae]|uniref:hypothetical protein n=1 Tax=Cyanophyceae TaxID=3028117 RepID=UPI001688CBD0|nr:MULTISPECIES: hypothetical protein [Cyanophyceae]MBD1916877.1 hypothetical protein [Phormidium sp. FACHB-77]MBD2028888.1 hypothetical protein [Phormidium sp. FACHB-322]MBD2051573.1 hypothetical protein [Leptolyngbya sp. FACHB-60]